MATTDSITHKSGDYQRRIAAWKMVRDALEGEEVIKAAGTEYLPKPGGLDSIQYTAYKLRASFFDVTDRTLSGLLGLVFRIEPRLELPAKLEPMLESATPDGSGLNLVIREAVRENTSMGRWGVLVDMSPDKVVGGFPYLATYMAEDILKWEERMERGVRRLVRVVLMDDSATADETTTQRILNLALDDEGLYVMEIFEAISPEAQANYSANDPNADIIAAGYKLVETIEPTAQGARLKSIPFWFVNTYDTRAKTSKPPMLALASMNSAHYRNSADYEHALYLTACPTPWTAGMLQADRPTAIGSGTVWHLPKGGQVGILEFTGAALQAQATAMTDKERRMAVLGARLIAEETRNVTAETTRLNAKSETSVLTEAVANAEAGLISALRFAAEWAGANPEDVVLEINRDYVETRMSPEELNALIAGWQMGAYSKDTLHSNLQRGEIIDPQRTVQDEQELIDDEDVDAPGGDENDEVKTALAAILANQQNGGNGDGEDGDGDGGGAGGAGEEGDGEEGG